MASHAFEPHTGEVKVRVDAATIEELFVEAARALAELLGVAAAEIERDTDWQHVTVTGRDREALLVAWLNELIARAEIDHVIVTAVRVDEVTEEATATRLTAHIRVAPFGETRTAVKAATMHDLRVVEAPGRVTATVVLDV